MTNSNKKLPGVSAETLKKNPRCSGSAIAEYQKLIEEMRELGFEIKKPGYRLSPPLGGVIPGASWRRSRRSSHEKSAVAEYQKLVEEMRKLGFEIKKPGYRLSPPLGGVVPETLRRRYKKSSHKRTPSLGGVIPNLSRKRRTSLNQRNP